MMMFGGSPIKVAVPPMLDAIASAIRNGTGRHPSRSHTSSVTGATSSTVVTLSSSADATAVITTSITMIANGLPRARLADQMARYSNTPVCLTMLTMTIIPSSKKMTFQSTPVSSLKNAACASTRRARPSRRRRERGGDPVDPFRGDQHVRRDEYCDDQPVVMSGRADAPATDSP